MIAIIGAGSIGVAWTVVFARAGHPVALHDVDAERLSVARAEVESRLADLARHGLADEPVDAVLSRVRIAPTLPGALDAALYVQECAAESLPLKRDLFAALDGLAAPGAVLASSTSMIPCSRFAAGLPGRARCLVVHPANPPYLLPVAELVPAPFTDPETVYGTRNLLSGIGMAPVVLAREIEGFVLNRLQGALLREAYCLVRDGVAAPEDIDLVVRAGLGRRWSVLGPFATAELNTRGGIERHAEIMGPAYARMGAERGQHDPWTPDLVRRVAAAIQRTLPPAQWADHVTRRDHALMGLEQARRAALPPPPKTRVAGTTPPRWRKPVDR